MNSTINYIAQSVFQFANQQNLFLSQFHREIYLNRTKPENANIRIPTFKDVESAEKMINGLFGFLQDPHKDIAFAIIQTIINQWESGKYINKKSCSLLKESGYNLAFVLHMEAEYPTLFICLHNSNTQAFWEVAKIALWNCTLYHGIVLNEYAKITISAISKNLKNPDVFNNKEKITIRQGRHITFEVQKMITNYERKQLQIQNEQLYSNRHNCLDDVFDELIKIKESGQSASILTLMTKMENQSKNEPIVIKDVDFVSETVEKQNWMSIVNQGILSIQDVLIGAHSPIMGGKEVGYEFQVSANLVIQPNIAIPALFKQETSQHDLFKNLDWELLYPNNKNVIKITWLVKSTKSGYMSVELMNVNSSATLLVIDIINNLSNLGTLQTLVMQLCFVTSLFYKFSKSGNYNDIKYLNLLSVLSTIVKEQMTISDGMTVNVFVDEYSKAFSDLFAPEFANAYKFNNYTFSHISDNVKNNIVLSYDKIQLSLDFIQKANPTLQDVSIEKLLNWTSVSFNERNCAVIQINDGMMSDFPKVKELFDLYHLPN